MPRHCINTCEGHRPKIQAHEKTEIYSEDYRSLSSTHILPTTVKFQCSNRRLQIQYILFLSRNTQGNPKGKKDKIKDTRDMKPQGNITITHNIYCAAHQIKILTLKSYFPHFVLPDATCLASSKKLQGRPKVKHTHMTQQTNMHTHTQILWRHQAITRMRLRHKCCK